MRRALLLAGAVLALVCDCAAGAQPPATGGRVSVPIREVDLSDGTRRYVVMLKIGETTVDAGLDTGSTGLRVLPGVLAARDADAGWRSDTYSYGSGAQFVGDIGKATLSFAPDVRGPLQIQLIRTVGCTHEHPRCPATRVPLQAYGIQGDGLPGEGFKAILGLNFAETTLPNPLEAIGVERWIVVLPKPAAGAPGELILNPTPEETAAYANFSLAGSVGFGLHDAVSGCIRNDTNGQTVCGPTVLDTGAPGLVIVQPGVFARSRIWPDGTPVTLAFMQGDHQRLGYDMQIGRRDQGSHLIMAGSPDARTPLIFTGIAPYVIYDVLYDARGQTIGLKTRAPIAPSP